MQQSDKLAREDAERREHYLTRTDEEGEVELPPEDEDAPMRIRPLSMFNDFIAVLQDKIKTDLELPSGQSGLPSGFVIGVPEKGNGLPDGAGGRLTSQCQVGDRVLFMPRNVVQAIDVGADDLVYKGQTILYMSEKNLFQKMTPKPFILVDQNNQERVPLSEEQKARIAQGLDRELEF